MLGSGKPAEQEDHLEGLGAPSAAATAFSFGKYQLFASLGRGGMADVFLAVSRGPMGFNKLVVIKRLRPALAEEAAFRQMFLDEARLAARLNHPNVVHTYEVGEHDGIYFIAMEYLEGQSLNKVMREIVKRGDRFEPALCVRVVADALSGLHHAHELRDYDGRPLNIIHRDVSPHNVFTTYDGYVKLVDFGIAKAALSSTETEVGVLKGKVAYMAPEQAMGGPIDHRADLFAMGIVLWELLAGQRLMTGDSAANTLHRLVNLEIPRVSSVVSDVDRGLDDILAKALEKEPENRYQTAAEMRDALESWLASCGRTVKQDEVGRLLAGMFARVREDVHRQIQMHMAAVAAASSTGELQALTADSLKRLEQSGATRLMHLGGGSGSLVSTFPPPAPSQPSVLTPIPQYAPLPQATPAPASGGRVVLLVMAVMFGLAFLVTLALLLRPRAKVAAAAPPTTMVAPTPPPPVAKVEPPPVSATASASASAAPSADTVATAKKTWPHAPIGRSHTPTSPASPTAPSATVSPASDDPGFLTLQTYPWTKVSEGGRPLGTTPLVRVSLPPGTHVLTLENADQGIKQAYTVTIKSGETFSRSLGLK